MQKSAKRETIRTALTEATPLALAVATYGLSYGVLATRAGLHLPEVLGMSLLVFSGTVQMVTVAMIMTGASIMSILVTSVLLNLRNLLYGAALSGGLDTKKKWRYLLAFGITDEPFVLGSSYFKRNGPSPLYYGVVTGIFYGAWILSSLIGAMAGNQIDMQKWGIDLAFPVTFMALLMPSLKERPAIATAVTAVVMALSLEWFFPGNNFTLILTGIVAPFVGLYLKRGPQNA